MDKIKLIRNILYIAGVTFFLSIIAYSIYHTHYMWVNEFKVYNFNSFIEYYFTRAKGEMVIAILAGIFPICVGRYISKK